MQWFSARLVLRLNTKREEREPPISPIKTDNTDEDGAKEIGRARDGSPEREEEV